MEDTCGRGAGGSGWERRCQNSVVTVRVSAELWYGWSGESSHAALGKEGRGVLALPPGGAEGRSGRAQTRLHRGPWRKENADRNRPLERLSIVPYSLIFNSA